MTALCPSLHGLISLRMFNSSISGTFNLKIQRGSIYNCRCILVLILLSVLMLNDEHQVGPAPGLSALLLRHLPGQSWGKCGQPLKQHHCTAELNHSLMLIRPLQVCVWPGVTDGMRLLLKYYGHSLCARRKLWRTKELELRVLPQSR